MSSCSGYLQTERGMARHSTDQVYKTRLDQINREELRFTKTTADLTRLTKTKSDITRLTKTKPDLTR